MARREHDDDDMGEVWRAHRDLQKARRAARLPGRQQEILDLKAKNFTVRKLTDFQFRIDGKLDLYPIHRRYHDLSRNKRGNYVNPLDIAVRVLRTGWGK